MTCIRKRVILVGHCSPDSSYLSIAVKSVCPDAQLERANDDAALHACLQRGADLLLVNRIMDGDFKDYSGIGLIARCRQSHPGTSVMLISNYADAQAEAIGKGALPGVGKAALNTPQSRDTLASALGGPTL